MHIQCSGIIIKNPYQHRIVTNSFLDGMTELQQIYHSNDAGCVIKLYRINNYTLELTWKRLFQDSYSSCNGIKVFGQVETPHRRFRNKFKPLKSIKKLDLLLECLKVFVAGDVQQTTFLIFDYSAQVSYVKLENSKKATKMLQQDQGPNVSNFLFEGPDYHRFLDLVDNTFDVSFQKCLTGWNYYTTPILSDGEVNNLLDSFKTNLPAHFEVFSTLRGISGYQRRPSALPAKQ